LFFSFLLESESFIFNKSEIDKDMIIKDKNHQTLFRKKARVGELNKYHIPVNVCQDIKVHIVQTSQLLAINLA
jgi:hypothetical protein